MTDHDKNIIELDTRKAQLEELAKMHEDAERLRSPQTIAELREALTTVMAGIAALDERVAALEAREFGRSRDDR